MPDAPYFATRRAIFIRKKSLRREGVAEKRVNLFETGTEALERHEECRCRYEECIEIVCVVLHDFADLNRQRRIDLDLRNVFAVDDLARHCCVFHLDRVPLAELFHELVRIDL